MDIELERWCNIMLPNESMEICNAILPMAEQDEIEERAHKAFEREGS